MRLLPIILALVSLSASVRAQEALEPAAFDDDDWRGRVAAIMVANDQPDDSGDRLTAPLIACWDTVCAKQSFVALDRTEAAALRALFSDAADAADERRSIGRAVALMETFIGRRNGTLADHPGNQRLADDEPGQLDCVSESVNTHTVLMRLEAADLLHRHSVGGIVQRFSFILQHQAVLMIDLADGAEYVVDSWPGAGGEEPEILPYWDWRAGWAV